LKIFGGDAKKENRAEETEAAIKTEENVILHSFIYLKIDFSFI
jgi:hypothetical protein